MSGEMPEGTVWNSAKAQEESGCDGAWVEKKPTLAQRLLSGDASVRSERRVALIDANTPSARYMRHWAQGPGHLVPFRAGQEERTTTDGVKVWCTHRYSWTLGQVPLGVERQAVIDTLTNTWQHSLGWVGAGLWIRYTDDPLKAGGVVHVGSAAGGNEGCNNCQACSCVKWPSTGKHNMWIHQRHLPSIFIKNHEMGHLALACCDMYRYNTRPVGPAAYTGVMDIGTQSTLWPTDHDKRDAFDWMHRNARYTDC
jgi:hypothetical protein